MHATPLLASPWYRHLWPWIIIGFLACSVLLTLSMVVIAVRHPDNLVTDNYYEAGKGINRSLERELLAERLRVHARIQLDALTGEVQLRLSGLSLPPTLALNLISPTQPSRDREVTLRQAAGPAGRYVGQLADPVHGRRFVELLGEENGHAWRLFEEELIDAQGDITLGDEPIAGAERRAD